MEFKDYLSAVVTAQRKKRFNESPQLSLGKLITEFESFKLLKDNGEVKTVRFDFGSAIPTELASWRGSYDELALGYKLSGYDSADDHFAECKADQLVKHLKEAIGKTYTGWKGGYYIMDESTPVWVDNPGDSGSTGIIGVIDNGYEFIIITGHCEY